MKTCSECKGKLVEKTGKTPEGIVYTFYRCIKCNEELVDMKQLHHVANKYREMKKYRVKLSKWGLSFGLRIPKELVNKYHFGKEVSVIPEKEGIKIMP